MQLQVYTTDSSLHSASVNSVAFAPHELGLKVAAASSDGSVSVLTYNTTEGKWNQQKVLCFANIVLFSSVSGMCKTLCLLRHAVTTSSNGASHLFESTQNLLTIVFVAWSSCQSELCLLQTQYATGRCAQRGLHSCVMVPGSASWLTGFGQATCTCHCALCQCRL